MRRALPAAILGASLVIASVLHAGAATTDPQIRYVGQVHILAGSRCHSASVPEGVDVGTNPMIFTSGVTKRPPADRKGGSNVPLGYAAWNAVTEVGYHAPTICLAERTDVGATVWFMVIG